MKNVKLFTTKQLRSDYEDSSNYTEPYVSLEEEGNEVKYNNISIIRITVKDGGNATLQGGITLKSGEHVINMKQIYSLPLGITNGKEYIEEVDLFDYNETSVGRSLFEGFTNLRKVYLSNKITAIEDWAFNRCTNLEEVINTENISSIGLNSFSDCSSLEKITFSDKINTISPYSFKNNTSLKNIIFNSDTPKDTFLNILQQIPTIQSIYVPQDAVRTYKTASGWSSYTSMIKPIEQ